MKFIDFIIKSSLLLAFIIILSGSFQAEAALTLEDCQKCHDQEYQQITSRGLAHKKLTCFGCHENHRPMVANNIPKCHQCHGGTPHQEVHHPLARTDSDTALLHCKSCHPEAYQLLKNSTSKHHEFSCSFCHPEHRNIQKCSNCHGKPHAEGIHNMYPQCNTCHNIAHDLNSLPKR